MRVASFACLSVRRNVTSPQTVIYAHNSCCFHAVRCRAAVGAHVIQLINDVLTIFRRYFDSQYKLSKRLVTLACMEEQTGCVRHFCTMKYW